MASQAEIRRAAGEELSRITNKWLRGRTTISDLQGSSLVITGDSAPQRAMLALQAEITADMNNFLGRELEQDEVTALAEIVGMWRNQVIHDGRQSVTLLDSFRR